MIGTKQLTEWRKELESDLLSLTESTEYFNAGHPENYYCDSVQIDPETLEGEDAERYEVLSTLLGAVYDAISAMKRIENPPQEDQYDPFAEEVPA